MNHSRPSQAGLPLYGLFVLTRVCGFTGRMAWETAVGQAVKLQMKQDLLSPEGGAHARTYNASDVVPNGQLVGFGFLPPEVVTQIKGQPEEEGVIHQLQAGIGQGVLQENHSCHHAAHSTAWPPP